MSDLRFMSPYLKGGGDSARRANRIRYFATRPGVEVLSDSGSQPATKKQKAYVLWGVDGPSELEAQEFH